MSWSSPIRSPKTSRHSTWLPISPRSIMSDPEAVADSAALEMENGSDNRSRTCPRAGRRELDFKNMGTMTIDADPELTPEAATADRAARAGTECAARLSGREKAPRGERRPFASRGYCRWRRIEPRQETGLPQQGGAEEKRRRARPLRPGLPREERPRRRKKIFSLKLALLIVLPLLAAAALWLALSGKLNFSGGEEPPPAAGAGGRAPGCAERRARAKPARRPGFVATGRRSRKKLFDEKFRRPRSFSQKGRPAQGLGHAPGGQKNQGDRAVALAGGGSWPPKMRAAEGAGQAGKAGDRPKPVADGEPGLRQGRSGRTPWPAGRIFFKRVSPGANLAVRGAKKDRPAWKKRPRRMPSSSCWPRIQQAQKIRLRAAYLNMSQADIAAMLRQGGRPPTQFEAHEHGGATVMLDFATGLDVDLVEQAHGLRQGQMVGQPRHRRLRRLAAAHGRRSADPAADGPRLSMPGWPISPSGPATPSATSRARVWVLKLARRPVRSPADYNQICLRLGRAQGRQIDRSRQASGYPPPEQP